MPWCEPGLFVVLRDFLRVFWKNVVFGDGELWWIVVRVVVFCRRILGSEKYATLLRFIFGLRVDFVMQGLGCLDGR
jgi:hypothetical protein